MPRADGGGAQLGNKHAKRGSMWADALRMELAQEKQLIRKLTRALIKKAASGDIAALKEIGDRLDGKAHQSISGPDGDSMTFEIIAPWLTQTIANRNKE